MMSRIADIIPQKVEGIDLYSLPLRGPQEAFLVNLVDGFATVEQLSSMCGLSEEAVFDILKFLSGLGAVILPNVPVISPVSPTSSPTTSGQPAAPVAAGQKSAENTSAGVTTAPAVAGGYSAEDPDPDIDLNPSAQKEINRMLDLGAQVNPFVLLGLDRDAGIAQLKKSYFKLAKLYHPDRFYGRNIGCYKERLDLLFERINHAYLTLNAPGKLDEYRPKDGEAAVPVAAQSVLIAADDVCHTDDKKDSSQSDTRQFSGSSSAPAASADKPVVAGQAYDQDEASVVTKVVPVSRAVPVAPKAAPVVGTLSSEELEARRRTIINQRRHQQNPFIDREERAEQAMKKGISLLKNGLLLEPSSQFALAVQLVPQNLFYRSLACHFNFDEKHPNYNDLLQIEVLVNSGYLEKAAAGYARLSKEYYREGAFHFMSGLLSYRLKKPLDTIQAVQKSLAASPDELFVWILASQAAVATKDNEAKEYYWKQATALANKLGCAIMEIGPLMALK